jgi:hypothetical protein
MVPECELRTMEQNGASISPEVVARKPEREIDFQSEQVRELGWILSTCLLA